MVKNDSGRWFLEMVIFLGMCVAIGVPGASGNLNQAQVVDVIDGDTIRVRFPDDRVDTVRYIGMNTPESTTRTECYGKKATVYNRKLVGGKTVWLELEVEKQDKYGRLLAYVYLDPRDEAMVNKILVAQGYAQVATYPPNVRYADDFRELNREAKEKGLGLWCECQDICGTEEKPEDQQAPENQKEDGPVVITCIHFDASGNDAKNKNGEWVVLEALEDTDMSGWMLRDEADHAYQFPDGFFIKEGETARVYTGSEDEPIGDTGCGENPDHELFWNFGRSAIWNNSGDVAYVRDAAGITSTECRYEGRGVEKACN